jgi:hypothetical protein
MHPKLESSITKEEADGLRKVRDVLVTIGAGNMCPFNVAMFRKHGLVKWIEGMNGPVTCGQPTKRTPGHWKVTDKGLALILNA